MDYPSRQFRLQKIIKLNNRIGILTSLSISAVVESSRLVHQETICRGQRPTHTSLWPLAQVSIVTMDDESSAVVTHHHHRVSCRIDCRRPQILRSCDPTHVIFVPLMLSPGEDTPQPHNMGTPPGPSSLREQDVATPNSFSKLLQRTNL